MIGAQFKTKPEPRAPSPRVRALLMRHAQSVEEDGVTRMTEETARRTFPRRRPVITNEDLESFRERRVNAARSVREPETGPGPDELTADPDDPNNPRGTTGIFDARTIAAVERQIRDTMSPAGSISPKRRGEIRKDAKRHAALLREQKGAGSIQARRSVLDLRVRGTGLPSAHIDSDGQIKVVPSAAERGRATRSGVLAWVTVVEPASPIWRVLRERCSDILIAAALLALVAVPVIEFLRLYGPR